MNLPNPETIIPNDEAMPVADNVIDYANHNGLLVPKVIRERSTKLFFDRLDHMVVNTHEYGGTLPAAWEEAEQGRLDLTQISSPIETHLNGQEERTIRDAVRKIKNAGITSVVIEAAHAYVYEDIDDPQLQESILAQTRKASALTKRLEESGLVVRSILFVDDYNPDPEDGQMHERLDIEKFVELTRSGGYNPEMVIKEAGMVALAKAMIDIMKDRQHIVTIENPEADTSVDVSEGASGSKALLIRKKIELHRIDEDMVSCAMLDAALTIVKFRYLGQGVMNILPRYPGSQDFSYKGQQQKVREIIREHLNVRIPPFFNLFVGGDTAVGAHNAFRKSSKKRQ